MQRTILVRSFLCRLLIAAVLVGSSGGQRRQGFPKPPESAVPDATTPEQRAIHRLDTVALEREARELSALASSVPGDVEQIKKGLLPSDTIEKLKRIEKLSKQLRGQIRP